MNVRDDCTIAGKNLFQCARVVTKSLRLWHNPLTNELSTYSDCKTLSTYATPKFSQFHLLQVHWNLLAPKAAFQVHAVLYRRHC